LLETLPLDLGIRILILSTASPSEVAADCHDEGPEQTTEGLIVIGSRPESFETEDEASETITPASLFLTALTLFRSLSSLAGSLRRLRREEPVLLTPEPRSTPSESLAE
jgi:hypothetical protein